jgi:hypothetical protein
MVGAVAWLAVATTGRDSVTARAQTVGYLRMPRSLLDGCERRTASERGYEGRASRASKFLRSSRRLGAPAARTIDGGAPKSERKASVKWL